MKKDTCSIVMHTKYYDLQLLGRTNSSVFSAQQHIAYMLSTLYSITRQ